MSDVPSYLRADVAAAFQDRNVAASYRYRPRYPPETFGIVAGLIVDEPRNVLDIGCGTGFMARPLAPLVDRIDAVDVSAAMIEEGRRLPGGDHPRLRWIVGRVEDAPLDPPYALATAGDSLHWMDWDVVLPRLADALSPSGLLAILDVESEIVPNDESFRQARLELIRRYTTFEEWRPAGFDLLAELKRRGLFREVDRTETHAILFRQSADAYVESYHARASLSWPRMDPDRAAEFDTELRQLVVERVGGEVEMAVRGRIVWGTPLQPQ